MALFEIVNIASGQSLGMFIGQSEDDALDAMARVAGYSDYAGADVSVALYSTSPGEEMQEAVKQYITAENDAHREILFSQLCQAIDASYEADGHSREEIARIDLVALAQAMIARAQD